MMPAMTLILRLIDICLFRAGPEDLPASNNLLKLSLMAYLAIGIAINLLDTDWMLSLAVSITDVLTLIAFTWILLKAYQHLPRIQQTLTALTGCSVLLGIVVMPLLHSFYQYDEASNAASVLLLLLMVIMLWSLMVTAHILRRALECSVPISIGWTIFYVILSIICSGLVMSGVA